MDKELEKIKKLKINKKNINKIQKFFDNCKENNKSHLIDQYIDEVGPEGAKQVMDLLYFNKSQKEKIKENIELKKREKQQKRKVKKFEKDKELLKEDVYYHDIAFPIKGDKEEIEKRAAKEAAKYLYKNRINNFTIEDFIFIGSSINPNIQIIRVKIYIYDDEVKIPSIY